MSSLILASLTRGRGLKFAALLSALALKRHLGVNYRTAWLVHQKITGTMAKADVAICLGGDVVVDDAYLGGEHPGTGGRGSPNKVPFVAAMGPNDMGHPL